jgi:tRNA(Ile)-lysidine synthase
VPSDASPSTDPAHHPLVKTVAENLRRAGIAEGEAVVVACSGGADSVALLRAMAMLAGRRRWRLRLIVGHVNHGLRPEADEEERFVKQFAKKLGLNFAATTITLDPDAAGNLEDQARQSRYAALIEMAKQHQAARVATGHHADDQLETLLMAILRGSTVRGLRGIARQRELADGIQLIRPMLDADHAQAIAFLKQLDQPWQEDATNDDRDRTRARLRQEVLPVLRDLRPGVAGKSVELADHLREVVEKLEKIENTS